MLKEIVQTSNSHRQCPCSIIEPGVGNEIITRSFDDVVNAFETMERSELTRLSLRHLSK